MHFFLNGWMTNVLALWAVWSLDAASQVCPYSLKGITANPQVSEWCFFHKTLLIKPGRQSWLYFDDPCILGTPQNCEQLKEKVFSRLILKDRCCWSLDGLETIWRYRAGKWKLADYSCLNIQVEMKLSVPLVKSGESCRLLSQQLGGSTHPGSQPWKGWQDYFISLEMKKQNKTFFCLQ